MLRGFLSALAMVAAATFGMGVARAQDLSIATAGPMTGQYATFGEQMRRGAEMAVADINAKGGVMGKKLKLEIGDDACDPKQAVAVANQMVGKKIAFMAGHFCSSSSIPASAVYNEAGILQMTPASTNPKLTDDAAEKNWDNIFRTSGRDDAQGVVMGGYIAEKFKGKNIAILHNKSVYGKALADQVRRALRELGSSEKMYENYTQGDKDFTSLIAKMRQANIDVMYVGGYHTEAGVLVRQAREQGLAALLMSGDALVDNEFWKIAGPAGEGTLMTFASDPRKLATAKDIVAKFKAQNYDPEGYTLYTYAAIQSWAQAVEKVKSTDTKKVAAELRKMTAKTVIGDLAWNKKGDLKNPKYNMYKWSMGGNREIGPIFSPDQFGCCKGE